MKQFGIISVLLVALCYASSPYDVVDPYDVDGLDIFATDTLTSGTMFHLTANAIGANKDVQLGGYSVVNGDVVTGGTIESLNAANYGQIVNGTIWAGTMGYFYSPLPYTQLTNWVNRNFLPPIGKTPSGDVVVGAFSSRDLSPGYYGNVQLNGASKLTLHPGNYYFLSLQALSNAVITYSADSGDINISVFDSVSFSNTVQTNFLDSVMPSRIHWTTWQIGRMDLLLDESIFYGQLVAPRAYVNLGERVKFIGGIHARMINLGYSTNICVPPELMSLSHSAGPMGPYFDPLMHIYNSVLPTTVSTDTLQAVAKPGVSVSYPDGQIISPSTAGGKYRIELYDPKRDSILPGCGKTEYVLNVRTGNDYAIRVAPDSIPCNAADGCDGSTWSKALPGLWLAMNIHGGDGKEYWLEQGSYSAGRRDVNDPTSTYFALRNAKIRGGFSGTETTTVARQGDAYLTVLNGKGTSSHVIVGKNQVYIEQVRVTGGNAGSQNGAGIWMGNGNFYMEQSVLDSNEGVGSGVAYYGANGSVCTINRAYISRNGLASGITSSLIGIAAGGTVHGVNLIESENSFSNGNIFNQESNSKLKLDYSTITSNYQPLSIFFGSGIDSVTNSVIWQPNVVFTNGSVQIYADHSLTSSALTGIGNLSSDPLFSTPSYGLDNMPFTSDDGLFPVANSPLIGGAISIVGDSNDILTFVRKSTPDIGAREYIPDLTKQIQIGLYNRYTNIFTPTNNIVSVNIDTSKLARILYLLSGSNYDYTIQAFVPLNKYTKGKSYIDVNIKAMNNDGTTASCPQAQTTIRMYRIQDTIGGYLVRTKLFQKGVQVNGNGVIFSSNCSLQATMNNMYVIPVNGQFKINYVVPKEQFE